MAQDEPRDRADVVVVLGNDQAFAERLAPAARGARVVCLADIDDWPAERRQAPPAVVLIGRTSSFAEAMRTLRGLRSTPHMGCVPAIVFGTRSNPREETEALSAGADDYVDRAAPIPVVASRIAALSRRTRADATPRPDAPDDRDQDVVRVGAIELDIGSYTVRVDGKQKALTAGEFELLVKLARNVGRVMRPAQLVARPINPNDAPADHAIRSRIFCLRRKLGRAAKQLQTVRTVGYLLTE